jgi:hypothetical protein
MDGYRMSIHDGVLTHFMTAFTCHRSEAMAHHNRTNGLRSHMIDQHYSKARSGSALAMCISQLTYLNIGNDRTENRHRKSNIPSDAVTSPRPQHMSLSSHVIHITVIFA